MRSVTWYSKGKSHYAEKYGGNGQGRFGFGGLVFPSGSLSVEVIVGDGGGVCNLEVFSHKGGVCCTYTMVHHEYIPDCMSQYI